LRLNFWVKWTDSISDLRMHLALNIFYSWSILLVRSCRISLKFRLSPQKCLSRNLTSFAYAIPMTLIKGSFFFAVHFFRRISSISKTFLLKYLSTSYSRSYILVRNTPVVFLFKSFTLLTFSSSSSFF
jgi:hypothetical protein